MRTTQVQLRKLALLAATAGLFLASQQLLATKQPTAQQQQQPNRLEVVAKHFLNHDRQQQTSNSSSSSLADRKQVVLDPQAAAAAATATVSRQATASDKHDDEPQQQQQKQPHSTTNPSQVAAKQEIICEQRLNYILMIQRKLNSTVTADSQRLILAACNQQQQQQQQQQQPLNNAATSTLASTTTSTPASNHHRSTNVHTNSTCPKETPASASAPAVASAEAKAPKLPSAANERATEFNVNQTATAPPMAEMLLATAADVKNGNESSSHQVIRHNSSHRSGQEEPPMHFGAKVALSILFSIILLVLSATLFDVLDAQRLARNSHTLVERESRSGSNHELTGNLYNVDTTAVAVAAAAAAVRAAGQAHRTNMNLYDQLRTCTSTCGAGGAACSRSSSISCSVTSSLAPMLPECQIKLAGVNENELAPSRYCSVCFKLTNNSYDHQVCSSSNSSETEYLSPGKQSSQEQDSDANTEKMLMGDDCYRTSRQHQLIRLHLQRIEHSNTRHQLIRQIFLSFSLCHSWSLIFHDRDRKSSNVSETRNTQRQQAATKIAAAAKQQRLALDRKQRNSALCRYHPAASSGLTGSACHRSRAPSLSSIHEQEAFNAHEAKQTATSNFVPISDTSFRCMREKQESSRRRRQQQQQPPSIDSLHGLRFLSMIWIIIIHTYSFAFQWSFFKYTSENIYKTAASQLIANGAFACDSFFLIGGFLLPYLTFPAYSDSGCSSSSSSSSGSNSCSGSSSSSTGSSSSSSSSSSSNRSCCSSRGSEHDSEDDEEDFRGDHCNPSGGCDLLYPLASPPASPSPIMPTKGIIKQDNKHQLVQLTQFKSPQAAKKFPFHLNQQQQADGSISSLSRSSLNNSSSRQSAAIYNANNHQYHHHQQQQAKLAPHLFPLNYFRTQQVPATNQQASNIARHRKSFTLHGKQSQKVVTPPPPPTTTTTKINYEKPSSSEIEFTFTRLLANLLHRYLRMMPLMMAIIGLSATLLRYLGEGPAWDYSTLMYDKWCRKNWWINALFLHNFLNRENMCLSHSWYAAVDIQLFLLGQVILFVLARSKRLGILMCCLFLFGGQLITAALTLWHHLPSLPLHASVSQQAMSLYYGEIYIKPYCRASPYLIGILLAYLMRTTSLGQVKLQRWHIATGWTASIGSLLLILMSTLPAMNGKPPGELESAIYNALSRPLWACATGWMVFACITKHGGILERILSAPQFIPFSRLSYPAFLIHPIVMAISYGGRQASVPFSHYLMLCLVLGNIVITYASAFVLSALFELPLLSVERAVKQTWLIRDNNNNNNDNTKTARTGNC